MLREFLRLRVSWAVKPERHRAQAGEMAELVEGA